MAKFNLSRQLNPTFWADAFKKAPGRVARGWRPFPIDLVRDAQNWNRCGVNEGRLYRNVRTRGSSFPMDRELLHLGSVDFPRAISAQDVNGARATYRKILDRVHTLYLQSIGV